MVFNESHPKYPFIKILQNPFYLHFYTKFLAHVEDLNDHKSCLLYSFNRYTILKEIYHLNYRRHLRETKEMVQEFQEEGLYFLRRLAFEYFQNNYDVNETIRELVNKVATEDQIITNQLSFYPLDLEALVKRDKNLFLHKQFLNYFVAEAYCFYMEKSYRSLNMNKLYSEEDLMNLMQEHYTVEHTHSKLV